MAGRVVVVQGSSSEDESMPSPTSVEAKLTETCQMVAIPANNNDKIYRYDREDMLKLYNEPAAKIRPSILSPDFDMVIQNGEGGNGDMPKHKLWSPELWIQSIWNPESRHANASDKGHGWTNRRQGDHDGPTAARKKPIDRLKTENEDGIVLSPQRRSFGAGCQVASASVSGNVGAHGSHTGGGSGGLTGNVASRRSASPLNSGTEDRQQTVSQHAGARSSFRSRVMVNSTNSGQSQQAPQMQVTGGYGRGDRNENWRDRTTFSSSFGRGTLGKDTPASINVHPRSRGNNMNSWNTGGNRRSYGGGGSYHGDSEVLPEWVTDGPADMFETMELRGFDEEEHQESQADRNSENFGDRKRMEAEHSGRSVQRGKKSITNKDFQMEQNISSQRSGNQMQAHRDSKSPKTQPDAKLVTTGDKIIGKVPVEALVDGFDIGDMAQFLSAAAPDFDSVKNGEFTSQNKSRQSIRKDPQSGVASRFSKFFTTSQTGEVVKDAFEDKADKQSAVTKKPQEPQPANIMDLLSKIAGTKESIPPPASLPAGAKSLDEIEASYKAPASMQNKDEENSSNKLLQELFQSARSTNFPGSSNSIPETGSILDKQEKEELRSLISQAPDLSAQQHAVDLMQRNLQNMATSGVNVSVKGNPLADPTQQQHFMEALRKLHIQRQQLQSATQHHGDAGPHNPASSDAQNSLLAAYPHLSGFHHLLQQQQQALQLGNLQAALNNSGRVPSPLGIVHGMPVIPPQAAGSGSTVNQSINPAFAGFLPPANVPPPPITQHDLLLAHSQAIYQRAVMNRKMQGGDEPALSSQKPSLGQQNVAGSNKVSTAFLPTAVIKQLHGASVGTKTKETTDDSTSGSTRPILKQQQLLGINAQEQSIPAPVNDQILRTLQQQNVPKQNQPPAVAPPPSMTPQDLQRLIDQTHLQQRQQRQQQERLLLEQMAKAQQHQAQIGPNTAAVNPAAVSAALALQNNPMFLQVLRAQAMQAQQMAMIQQQAAAVAGSGVTQSPSQPIPASVAVSAMPAAAQLVRARLPVAAGPPAPGGVNQEFLRQLQQQQHQQQQQQALLNQLRQQAPAEANLLLNRLLTGQTPQQHVHPIPGLPMTSPAMGGTHFPPHPMPDVKPMALEELERLHKQAAAAMQQP